MIKGKFVDAVTGGWSFALRNWKWGAIAGALLLAKCQYDGKVHWRDQAGLIEAQAKTFAARVQAATATFRAAGLDRLVRVQKQQITIQLEENDAIRSDRDALRDRYNRLRAQYRDASGRPLAAVPEISPPRGGFEEDPAHPGFFAIPAETAVTLMQACDGWVISYDRLLKFADRQAGVTVDLPPETPAP